MANLHGPLGTPGLSDLGSNLIQSEGTISKERPEVRGVYGSELLKDRVLRFEGTDPVGPVAGEVYAITSHDTAVVDLTLRLRNPVGAGEVTTESLPISSLKRLNPGNCLTPSRIGASFGQTLILFVDPGDGIAVDETRAREYMRLFLADAPETYNTMGPARQGNLLGGPVFEYESAALSAENYWHIVVWILNNDEVRKREKDGLYYLPQISLLLTRAKILHCFRGARQRFEKAEKAHEHLREIINRYYSTSSLDSSLKKETLEEYKAILRDAPRSAFEHALLLQEVEIQQSSLEANQVNFEDYLNRYKEKTETETIEPFRSFLLIDCPRYLSQIRYDISMLRPTQAVYNAVISSIRGRVQIEEKEISEQKAGDEKLRDRQMQLNIAFFAAAIGFSQLGLAVLPKIRELWITNEEWTQLDPVDSLTWSLQEIGGLLAAAVFLAFLVRGVMAGIVTSPGDEASN